MMLSNLRTFPEQVLSKNSDILEREDVQVAAKAYCNVLLSGKSAQWKDTWKTATGLPAAQSFPPHVA